MGSVNVFDGKEDVLGWLLKIKAKLISKGYKSVLTDVTTPGVVAVDTRAVWNAFADTDHLRLTCIDIYLDLG